MSKRVRQVKRGLRSDRKTLRKLRGSVTGKSSKNAVLGLQKRLSANQLILDKVLERIAFHKRRTKDEQARNRDLRRRIKALRKRRARGG